MQKPIRVLLIHLLLILLMYLSRDFISSTFIILNSVLLLASIFIKSFSRFIIWPLVGVVIYLLRQEAIYGFSPEIAASFLISVSSLRIMQNYAHKHKKSDILFYFLYLGSLSLFNNSFIFIVINFTIAILSFSLLADIDIALANIWKNVKTLLLISLGVFPLTMALFLFFPRVPAFLPKLNTNSASQIGYATSIQNSNISQLKSSNQVAFYALIAKQPQNTLYWRGRVLNYTDGYNWKRADKLFKQKTKTVKGKTQYELKYQQSFDGDMILLDKPIEVLSSKLNFYQRSAEHSFHSYQKNQTNSVKAVSANEVIETKLTDKDAKNYLQLPGFEPSRLKEIIAKVNASTPQEVLINFKNYLFQENFIYSLRPGKMQTMAAFLENKKGFCTHFSSLLAITLRKLNIPARVIIGFQGGEYNQIASFYTVRSSDAHAWVEYFDKGQWLRVDPTAFIIPERVESVAQFENGLLQVNQQAHNFWALDALTFIQSQIDFLNYHISVFMDGFDRSYQQELATKFTLDAYLFYVIGFMIVLLLFFYIKWLLKNRRHAKLDPLDKIFVLFCTKLNKHPNLAISPMDGIQTIKEKIAILSDKEQQKALAIIESYVSMRYRQQDFKLKHLRKLVNSFRI